MATLPFAPPESDASVMILERIFGSAITQMVSDDKMEASMQFVGALFYAFNVGLLIIAGIIASYVAIVGTANTANDGQALGKQWSSTWTPVRIVSAAAVLLPTASGFSFLQLFVLACALWGVNLANQVYEAGLEHILIAKTFANADPDTDAYDYQRFEDAIRQVACMAIARSSGGKSIQIVSTGDTGSIENISANLGFEFAIGEPKTKTEGKETKVVGSKNAICGELAYMPNATLLYDAKAPESVVGKAFLDGALQNSAHRIQTNLVQRRLDALKALYSNTVIDKIGEIAQAAYQCNPNANNASAGDECLQLDSYTAILRNYLDTYYKKVQAPLSSVFTDGDQKELVSALVEDLKGRGWAMSPGWFHKTSTLMKHYRSNISAIPAIQVKPTQFPDIGDNDRQVMAQTAYTAIVNATHRVVAAYQAENSAAKANTLAVMSRMGDPYNALVEDFEKETLSTAYAAKNMIDNFPGQIVLYMLPTKKDTWGGGSEGLYSPSDYITAKGSNLPQNVQLAASLASGAAQKFMANIRMAVFQAFKGEVGGHGGSATPFDLGNHLQLCQRNVLGMGASLFRAQCIAETALQYADDYTQSIGHSVSAGLKRLGVNETLSNVVGSIAGVAQRAINQIGTESNKTTSAAWVIIPRIESLVKVIQSYRLPLTMVAAGLPMLPYFIFIFGVVGWVLGVIQALVAAPLWACLHMTPGQSFIGSERQGYMLLLSLFVRPGLLMLSLMLAFWLCDPLVDYYTIAFAEASRHQFQVSTVRGGLIETPLNVMGILGGYMSEPALRLILYFVGLMSIFATVFMLAQTLPNAVLRWLNMNVEDLGSSQGADVLKSRMLMMAGAGHMHSAAAASAGAQLKPPSGGSGGASAARPINR